MGLKIFDQYTLLHFAVGVVSYFWNMSIRDFLIIHTIFEIVENTQFGMNLINNYVTIWPGGKPHPNAIINRVGDTIGAAFGWIVASKLDEYYRGN